MVLRAHAGFFKIDAGKIIVNGESLCYFDACDHLAFVGKQCGREQYLSESPDSYCDGVHACIEVLI